MSWSRLVSYLVLWRRTAGRRLRDFRFQVQVYPLPLSLSARFLFIGFAALLYYVLLVNEVPEVPNDKGLRLRFKGSTAGARSRRRPGPQLLQNNLVPRSELGFAVLTGGKRNDVVVRQLEKLHEQRVRRENLHVFVTSDPSETVASLQDLRSRLGGGGKKRRRTPAAPDQQIFPILGTVRAFAPLSVSVDAGGGLFTPRATGIGEDHVHEHDRQSKTLSSSEGEGGVPHKDKGPKQEEARNSPEEYYFRVCRTVALRQTNCTAPASMKNQNNPFEDGDGRARSIEVRTYEAVLGGFDLLERWYQHQHPTPTARVQSNVYGELVRELHFSTVVVKDKGKGKATETLEEQSPSGVKGNEGGGSGGTEENGGSKWLGVAAACELRVEEKLGSRSWCLGCCTSHCSYPGP